MALTFGCNFDSSVNETCSNTAPDYIDAGLAVQTVTKKFGVGSLKQSSGGLSSIYWLAFPMTLDNNGAIGIWVLYNRTNDDIFYVDVVDSDYTGNGISLILRNDPGLLHRINLDMYDDAYNGVISSTWDGAALAPGWHYYELNWLWNDAGGITELSHNGTVRISSTNGNTKSRSGSTTHLVELDFPVYSLNYVDDFGIFDQRLHTGGFSVPTASQIICPAAGVKRPLTLGAPFGGMNNMGR